MIWFRPDNIESGGKCGFAHYWNSQQPLAPLSEFNCLCLCILDQPGLNFNAINLKILQLVGLLVVYNLLEILEIRMAFICAIWTHKNQEKDRQYGGLVLFCNTYQLAKKGCCKFQYCANPYFPLLSISSGRNQIIVQGCTCLFFVNCELTL